MKCEKCGKDMQFRFCGLCWNCEYMNERENESGDYDDIEYTMECSMCGKETKHRECGMCVNCEQVWNG